MKRIKVFARVFMFMLCLSLALSLIGCDKKLAYAEEIGKIENVNGTTVVGDINNNEDIEYSKNNEIESFIKEQLTPLLSGLITAFISIIALLVPYIKTFGKLKKTQGAYASMYNENEKLSKLTEKINFDQKSKEITSNVISEIEKKFKNYDNALSHLLKETEITSAQLSTLIEGAKIAWKEAEGANLALCKVPSATLLAKQSLTIDFLKSFVAEKLGLMREELEEKIEEELNKWAIIQSICFIN